ncbi:hypothetical protein BJY04DRAFT_176617 [Aspergillus karnatakaensis]|uniref:uncharacterized protein n=1 Tax=Aspergillus karnatakaensis TaxID=1810916 RepID=UPI003CCD174E
MGSRFLCKKLIGDEVKNDMITWKDTGDRFCLVEDDSELSLSDPPPKDLVYKAGTSSAVWPIGSNAICRVKTWTGGMEMESDTIAFVKTNCPDIPVPDVIYAWLDEKLSRTFLILRRIQGRTLARAWPYLTPEMKDGIASTVARYCSKLTGLTSDKLQSATGRGVYDNFLNVHAEKSHPSWKPRLLGPMSVSSFQTYLQRISRSYNPPDSTAFHFYHADLGPTNLLLSDDGEVKAILDWESAGFYPKY